MQTLVKNKSGFTLIELLMAMVTGIIVLAGIYAAFSSQQKIHTKEQQVVDAEQNVRGAAHFMVREIRFAGMDETGTRRGRLSHRRAPFDPIHPGPRRRRGCGGCG